MSLICHQSRILKGIAFKSIVIEANTSSRLVSFVTRHNYPGAFQLSMALQNDLTAEISLVLKKNKCITILELSSMLYDANTFSSSDVQDF